MECVCNKCGMGVKGMKCSKCSTELVKDTVTKDSGEKIPVAKCPQGCGMVKPPSCCNHEMVCK